MKAGMFFLITACAGAPTVATTVTSSTTAPPTTTTTVATPQTLFAEGVATHRWSRPRPARLPTCHDRCYRH